MALGERERSVAYLLLADVVLADAQCPHAARGALDLLQYVLRIFFEIFVQDHVDFGMAGSLGDGPAAEHGDFGDGLVDEHPVQAGGADEAGGAG